MLVTLLAATVIAVPLSRRLGFGSIVGYLLAGVAIGPWGLRLVTDVQQIADVSELGVVMLLFLIGLELQPHRLWVLRRTILGLGFGQLVPTAALLAGMAYWGGIEWPDAAVLGLGLALSSTAIVLPMLRERNVLSSPAGRDGFAVLLFQDMAFIPIAAAVSLLSGGTILHGYAVARGPARYRRDRCHPVGRQSADTTAVSRNRRRQHPGSFHRNRPASGGGSRRAGALGRAVHVAWRVHGRRGAVGIPSTGTRSRPTSAVPGPAARLLLHLRRYVHRSSACRRPLGRRSCWLCSR